MPPKPAPKVPPKAAPKVPPKHHPDDSRLAEPPESLATVYAALVGIWDQEADRFWIRSNVMLIANGALIGYYFQQQQKISHAESAIIAALGVLLASIWMNVNLKGGYYVARWRPAIEAYERFMNAKADFGPLPLTSVRPDREVDFNKYKGNTAYSKAKNVIRGKYVPRSDAGDQVHLIASILIAGWLVLAIVQASLYIASLSHSNRPATHSGHTAICAQILIKNHIINMMVSPILVCTISSHETGKQ